MSQPRRRPGRDTSPTAGSPAHRLRAAWRVLPHERRLAAGAAAALFVTLFLPWYQETVIASGTASSLRSASASLTGWGAFSFVEAAVLLVAAGVLVLLFVRAEGRAFHVPGGDGGVITAAGFWTSVLIVWRMFDKEGTTGHGQYATTSGIEWGIFIAVGVAVLLAYAGSRIKSAHEPEPPLPGEGEGERPAAGRRSARMPAVAGGLEPGRPPPRPGGQAQRTRPAGAGEAATRPRPPRAGTGDAEGRPRPQRAEPDRRAERALDFSELEEIKFDEPPEPPTIRRATRETSRLDRPD